MPAFKWSQSLVAGAALVLAGGVRADVVSLVPIDAQAETQNGQNWTITPGSSSLNASRFASTALERRGVLEFALVGIPAGSTIQSAVFNYTIGTFTSGAGNAAAIEFHGYAGNGVPEVADATVPFNLIGTSAPVTALGPGSTTLDPAYIQSRIGVSPLGIMMYQQTISRQAAINSSVWPVTTDRPRLTITFTPPASPTLNISPLDARARRTGTSGWTVDAAATSMPVYRSDAFSLEDRAIMEFPLAGIPHRSMILSARLMFSPSLRNFPPDPVIEFHGYAGDGALTVGDAARPFNLIGTQVVLDFVRYTTTLNAAYVQSLIGINTHFGVYGYQPVAESQTGLFAAESVLPDMRPVLEVRFVPPACAVDFNGVGGVTVQDVFDFLDAYFALRPSADFNGVGGVTVQDVFDFLNAYFAGC